MMLKRPLTRLNAALLIFMLAVGMLPRAVLAATAPSISWQPEDYNASAGWIVTFDVWANGTQPLFYQWKKDGISLTDGGNIGGSTTESLIIGNVQESDEGSYSCYIYNTAGNVTSSSAALTVDPAVPSIMLQPASQTVTAGDMASFKVGAVRSEPFGCRWKKDGADLADGGRLSGADTDTLSFSSVTVSDAGSYTCHIVNAAGNADSSVAVLTVNLHHTPPAIIT
jgi:uncharacterized protein YodC (DUF2158 family)